jgi:catechol 2,3-dioxygenase-like lactoylglutathione lyase family enzyme
LKDRPGGKGAEVILGLDHINIATARLGETRDFFVQVLGLEEGPRPTVDAPGYWLYAGDRPLVHLMGLDPVADRAGAVASLDHFAFEVADLSTAKARLAAHGVQFREGMVLRGRGQLFLKDPNGVRIELGGPEG